MSELCCLCEKRVAGEYAIISFEIDGLEFKSFKLGVICPECEAARMGKMLAKYANFITKEEDGAIAVNWSMYALKQGEHRGEEAVDEMLELLSALGIFSLNRENAWNIDGGGVPCNPRRNSFLLFFTRKEDAVGYAEACFGGSHYPVTIFRSVDCFTSPKS